MTIAVGNKVSRLELEAITGHDTSRNVYVGDFDDIVETQFIDRIVDDIKGMTISTAVCVLSLSPWATKSYW